MRSIFTILAGAIVGVAIGLLLDDIAVGAGVVFLVPLLFESSPTRQRLWEKAVKNHPQGQVLSRWLLVVRAVLFPLDTFYWRMSKTRGYDWQTDSWNIEGVRYPRSALNALRRASGECYPLDFYGESIVIKREEIGSTKISQPFSD